MKSKSMRVFFLDVSKRDSNEPFKGAELTRLFDVINTIPLKKENDVTRVVEIDGNVFYLITSKDDKRIPNYTDCITGLFVKDRKFNYPYTSNENCELAEILLSNDKESISEVTFFLIDTKLSAMLWISNRYVSSFNKLTTYISLLDKGTASIDSIHLAPFLRANQNDRLDRAKYIKSYTLRLCSDIADLINVNQSSDAQLKDFQNAIKNHMVNYVDVKFTFNHDPDQKGIINRFIKVFSRKDGVDKAQVSVNKDDTQDVIDMLCDEFMVFTKIEYEDKYIPYESIFNKLKIELDMKKAEIIRRYRRNSHDIQ